MRNALTRPAGLLSRLLCLALLGLLVAMAAPASKAGAQNLQPGTGNAWLAIASRTDANDAIALAQQYSGQFPGATVFLSNNGFYSVTLGWARKSSGEQLLNNLISQGQVPSDSYFTLGARFAQVIWSASGAQDYALQDLLAATRINNQAGNSAPAPDTTVKANPVEPSRAIVSGLSASGDNFLSLRQGPGSGFAEIARMQANTSLTVTGTKGGWFEVTLTNGMRGWAFGKYIVMGDSVAAAPPKPAKLKKIPVIGPDEPVEELQPDEPEIAALPNKKANPVKQSQPQKQIGDQKRVALVLGNSAYENAVQLPNPKNDAAAIAEKLASLGFTVISGLDGTKSEMEKSIREFVKVLEGADVALLFYAGHGMQVAGINYLIPVDAKLEESTALDFETISLTAVLNFMNTEERISIVLLDACRDNPLARKFSRSLGKTRSALLGRGLARPDVGSGEILIGFATSPGETAADGEGANSPFTTALMTHLDASGLDIEQMMKRVKRDVYEATQEEQEPFVESGLRQEFFFNPTN